MSDGPVELYLKHRPTNLMEIAGQKKAVETLRAMARNETMPHVMLFTGPSGTGKTTLARIVRKRVGIHDNDFEEMNTSDFRGIDDIRALRERLGYSPMFGSVKGYYLDECHGLTSDAQEALLKLLEDTPAWVYFFLATTNKSKLKKTIVTRCTEIALTELLPADLVQEMNRVLGLEGKTVDPAVLERIADVADGSARKALVILHQVMGITGSAEQLRAVQAADVKTTAIDIARLLLTKGTPWKTVAGVLQTLEDDAEATRRVIIGYAKSVLLSSGNPRAAFIIEEFRQPLYDIGLPGLVASCFNVVTG